MDPQNHLEQQLKFNLYFTHVNINSHFVSAVSLVGIWELHTCVPYVLIKTTHSCLCVQGAGLSTGAWVASKGPHLWRKASILPLAAIDCQCLPIVRGGTLFYSLQCMIGCLSDLVLQKSCSLNHSRCELTQICLMSHFLSLRLRDHWRKRWWSRREGAERLEKPEPLVVTAIFS